MSETKHTPGPWHIHEDGMKFSREIYPVNYGGKENTERCVLIARVSGWKGGFNTAKEAEANARLIAAAPELLEALQAVVRIADRKTVEFDKARAAIAKATGAAKEG